MNRLGNILNVFSELRYIAEALQFSSPLGKKRMLNQRFLYTVNEIEERIEKTDAAISFLSDTKNMKIADAVRTVLHQAQDIDGALRNLQADMILDDIELFEIKKFALLAAELKELLEGNSLVSLGDTESVITILDPEHKRIPRFFIYDEYDRRLTSLRKKIRQSSTPPAEKALLETECSLIEDTIRQQLSEKLKKHYQSLQQSFTAFAELDFQLAKADFCISYHCSRPVISEK
ncbi:MAG: hypothetical protein IPM85_06135 [Chitinophagaceae bacterium]|nr:hypothetical protein [Chitinophagaceae bacterium]